MSKRSRGHYAPPNSRVVVPSQRAAVIPTPAEQENQRQFQEAQIRMKVEGVAAAVYSHLVSRLPDDAPQFSANLCAQKAVDYALVFAAAVWGVQGQRVQPMAPPSDVHPPQPIVE